MKHTLSLFASLLLTAAVGNAGVGDPVPDLASWRALHGDNWRAHVDTETGTIAFLYGGTRDFQAQPVDDDDYFALARLALAETGPMHGVDAVTLVEKEVVHLPLGFAGTTDKMTVSFRQEVAGVPVEQGWANVLFDMNGRLLSVDHTGLPGLTGFPATPAVDAAGAAAAARLHYDATVGHPPHVEDAPVLVIRQQLVDGHRLPVLAWRVELLGDVEANNPEGLTVWVAAADGSILHTYSNCHQDVTGNVASNATPGERPDGNNNPPVPLSMPHMEVTSSAGIFETDENGDYALVGVDPPVSLTMRFFGPFAEVNNAAGPPHAFGDVALAESGNQTVMNPAGDPTVTAQANAFRYINLLRDWTRSVNPSDNKSDFQATANVNLPAPCNAFWTNAAGGSVNFFIQNLCANSSYSTVVLHEMGHWMNARYGSGNGGDGFGEGNADVFAMYLMDTPIVGRNFSGNGTWVRNGNNTRKFCGDCCGGCYGGVHTDGEVLMGALWKVRRNLKATNGTKDGGDIADSLFNGWMNAYNDSQIKSVIETRWLTLDDNDGDLSNGTPHYFDIDEAFREQGFPGVDADGVIGTNFCMSEPNSTGQAATIEGSGSRKISDNDVTLRMSPLPPNKNGYFLMAQSQDFIPFFGGSQGHLCLGVPVYRIADPVLNSGPNGEMVRVLDLTDLPQNVQFQPGQNWYFQGWYRDKNPGKTSNTSDGLLVTWQ